MKYCKLIGVLLLLPALLAVAAPAQVKGGAPYRSYLPMLATVLPEQKLGPFFAKTTALAVDPRQAGVVYVGTWGGGVFKSSDYGVTWTPVNDGLTNLMIQSLAVDPRSSQNVYAGVYYDALAGSGVFKSTDGGLTWHATGKLQNTYHGTPVSRPVVYAVAVDPSNSNILYAGTRMKDLVPGQLVYGGGGVFKSTNQGQSWAAVNTGLPGEDLYVYGLAVNPDNPNQVFAALHVSGPYASSDGGAHWSPLSAGSTVDLSGRAILVDTGNSNALFYATWHDQGVYYSANQGAVWKKAGVAGVGGLLGLAQDPSDSRYLLAMVWQKSSADPPSRLYFSDSHGTSWSGIDAEGYYQAAFDPFNGSIVYGGTGNGFKISSNRGGSWGYSNFGLAGYSTPAAAVNPAAPNVVYAAVFGLGVFKSGDRGLTWQSASAGLPPGAAVRSLAIDPNQAQVLYLATADSGVFRTANGGASWSALAAGYPAMVPATAAPDLYQNQVRPGPELFAPAESLVQAAAATSTPANVIAVAPDSSTVLAGTGGHGVLRFNGVSGWLPSSLVKGKIETIVFDRAGSGRVFAGAAGADGSLYVSADRGVSWTLAADGLAGRTVYALCQSPDKPDVWWAGTNAGVYRSEDHGAHWAVVGLADSPVSALYAYPDLPGGVLAGTPDAMFLSSDYGTTWTQKYSQLGHVGIQAIVANPADPNSVYLATRFAGIVRVMR